MSARTKFYTDRDITLENLTDIIGCKYSNIDVIGIPEDAPSWYIIGFFCKSDGYRQISFSPNNYGEHNWGTYNMIRKDNVTISIGCFGDSINIIYHIANHLGGYVCENDQNEYIPDVYVIPISERRTKMIEQILN